MLHLTADPSCQCVSPAVHFGGGTTQKKERKEEEKSPSSLVHTVVSASMDAVVSVGSHCTDGSVPAVCAQQLKSTAAKLAAVGIMFWCVFVVAFCALFVFLQAQKIPHCTFAATLHNLSGVGLDAVIGRFKIG